MHRTIFVLGVIGDGARRRSGNYRQSCARSRAESRERERIPTKAPQPFRPQPPLLVVSTVQPFRIRRRLFLRFFAIFTVLLVRGIVVLISRPSLAAPILPSLPPSSMLVVASCATGMSRCAMGGGGLGYFAPGGRGYFLSRKWIGPMAHCVF